MSLLAASLSRLLDAAGRYARGEVDPAAVRPLLGEARAFCQEGRQLFAAVTPGILRTPTVDSILQDCQRDLADQEESLRSLEEALDEGSPVRAGKAAGRLEAAARSLAEAYGRLQVEERKEKVYSPFAVVDHFVKTVLNVLERRVPTAELARRFPPVVALVARMERDVRRFEALYGEPAVVGAAGDAVAGMQAGLGAAMEFFESRSPAALADAARLLGRHSSALHEVLGEMDRVAAAARSGSKHPYLEEVRRTLEAHREGRLSAGSVDDAWSMAEAALEHYRREILAFREFPLFPFMEGAWAPARQALAAAEQALGRAREAAETASLEAPFDALQGAVSALYDRLEAEMDRYREAPHVEELRDRVGRALLGAGPDQALGERVERLREVLGGLAEQTAGLEPALGAELRALFAAQDEAYAEMLAAVAARDCEALRRGWGRLEDTLPRTLELMRGLRQALGVEEPGSSVGPVCVRCGRSHEAGTRYCAGCGAILPEVQRDPTDYMDLEGGGGAVATGNLARLEALLAGEAGAAEVCAELDSLQELAHRVARSLQQQVGPQAQADPQVAEYAGYFQERLDRFAEGLSLMRHHAEGGDLLWQGLEVCRQASSDLAEMKQQLDAALRGG